jgi:hypothetical protein
LGRRGKIFEIENNPTLAWAFWLEPSEGVFVVCQIDVMD